MNKLSLKKLKLEATDILESKQLKSVYGGYGGYDGDGNPGSQSCFSFYHGIYTEHFGGVNLGNVGEFNELVAQCEYVWG